MNDEQFHANGTSWNFEKNESINDLSNLSWINETSFLNISAIDPDYPEPIGLQIKIFMTLLYVSISVVGVLGNIGVCVVVVQNRLMHTATNYYLCSMALSDLLLLVTGMPHELFVMWVRSPYVFGLTFCVVRGLTAEMTTNASILTIAAFTVERYIGICHPLRSHVMSHLGRVIKFIILVWIVAFICALPQCMQYGITHKGECNILYPLPYSFEVSTFLFFIMPMTLITVLYVKIVLELRRSPHLGRYGSTSAGENTNFGDRSRSVINMLVAVVLAFFVCFAPFHAQRLVAFYGDPESKVHRNIYAFLTNVSGVTFYISTCINPVLYHILSRRFRQAFKETLRRCCVSSKRCGCCDASAASENPYLPGSVRLGYNRSVTRNPSMYQHRLSSNIPFSVASLRNTNNNKYHRNALHAQESDSSTCNNSIPYVCQATQSSAMATDDSTPKESDENQLNHHTWV